MKWKAKNIDASVTLVKPELSNSPSLLDICKKPSVSMVTWNADDSLVVTAQNNFIIKVWNSNDVQLVHELKSHSDEIFVLFIFFSSPFSLKRERRREMITNIDKYKNVHF